MSGILRLANDASGQSTLNTNATDNVTYSLPDTTGDAAALILTDRAHQVASINWDGIAVNIENGDINLDSGTLFIDEDTDSVGIGTTSPEQKLHVSNGGLAVETAVNAALTVGQDVDGSGADHLGIYYGTGVNATASADIFTSNGDLRIRVDGNGSASGGQIRFHHGFSENVGTIQLDPSDGSATFAGNVQSGGEARDGIADGVMLRDAGLVQASRTGRNNSVWAGYETLSSVPTSLINADGSAQFADDVQMASQNGGPLAGFRNQIINGDFRVKQYFSNATGSNKYITDRWVTNDDTTGATPDVTDVKGATKGLRLDGGQRIIRQLVELPLNDSGDGTSGPFYNGSQWTMSIYATVAPNQLAPSFTDSGLSGTNNQAVTGVPGWTATSDVQGAYTRYTCTFTVNTAPVASNKGFRVNWSFPSAATFTLAQLEPGPVATPFEHRPIGTELALCQRYFQKYYPGNELHLTGAYSDSQLTRAGATLPITMRAAPSLTSLGTFQTWNGVSVSSGGAIEQAWANPSSIEINIAGSLGTATQAGVLFLGGFMPGSEINLSAEL